MNAFLLALVLLGKVESVEVAPAAPVPPPGEIVSFEERPTEEEWARLRAAHGYVVLVTADRWEHIIRVTEDGNAARDEAATCAVLVDEQRAEMRRLRHAIMRKRLVDATSSFTAGWLAHDEVK